MEGNKPKQQREKPVDKQTNLNLNEKVHAKKIEIDEKELGEEFMLPDYRPHSLFTKKQVPFAKKKKLRKIARKSKQVNRRRAKNK